MPEFPRAVLDTNVLLSAAATEGICHGILEEANQEGFKLFFSPFILHELKRVLAAKFHFTKIETAEYLNLIAEIGHSIDPEAMGIRVAGACRDRDDDNIIAAAVASNSDFIVTGDHDLLELKKYGNISIVTPKDFLHKITNA